MLLAVVSIGQSRASNEDVRVAWGFDGADVEGFRIVRTRTGAGTTVWPEDDSLLSPSTRSVDLVNKLRVGRLQYQIHVEAIIDGESIRSNTISFTTTA